MKEERIREILTQAQRGMYQQLTPLETEVLALAWVRYQELRRLMEAKT